MLEVHSWEPNANSGKSLLCLKEKQAPFIFHYVDMDTARLACRVAGPHG